MAWKSIISGFLLGSAYLCDARLFQRASDVPDVNAYDYLIVGGGLSGAVVANRLTENSDIKVLIVEAGASHQGDLAIQVPGLQSFTGIGTPYNWNYTSIPQANLDDRTLPAPQGHVLGGGTSINGMWYTRGTSDDYDRWAQTIGDAEWSWSNLQSYFRKSEKLVPPADNRNTSGQFDPDLHGTEGLLAVTLPGFTSLPLDDLVIGRAGDQFPFVEDYQNGSPNGIGWIQTTILKGARSSAATAFLDPFLNRPNLDVVVNTRVTRVSSSTGTAIDTIEFDSDGGNATSQAKAGTEILLAAGVFNTPHLLLNSGIGDEDYLQSLNIPVVANIPSVGKNLSEHPAIGNAWNTTLQHVEDPTTDFDAALVQWNQTKTGRLTMAVSNNVVWLRMNESVPAVQSIFNQFGDVAPGPGSPHIELLPTISAFDAVENFANRKFVLDTVDLYPQSRGSVTLDPANHLGPPLIDYNFYSSPADLLVMRQAVLTGLQFLETPDFQQFLGPPLSPQLSAIIDAVSNEAPEDSLNNLLDAYILSETTIALHPVGTCSMSPQGSGWGVVDPDFRVKGLVGLRIVDSSIMPYLPAAHIQAAVYVAAERAADIIKG